MEGLDLRGIMQMAHKIASSAAASMDVDEKENIKSMGENDAVNHITNKVMSMMGGNGLNLESLLLGNDSGTIDVDVTVTDVIKGISNKKIKYKRYTNKTKTKEKVIINTEPMTLKRIFTFEGLGDDGSDLKIRLNIKPSDGLSITSNNDLYVRRSKNLDIGECSVTIVNGLDIELNVAALTSSTFTLKNKGLLLDDGSRSDLIVELFPTE